MDKQLARSMWFASFFILFSGLATAAEFEKNQLDQRALMNPEAVTKWLEKNAKTADRKFAQITLEYGVKAEKQGNSSAAVKSFGESALSFPAPMTLIGYADNTLRMLSHVRTREKDTSKVKSDLSAVLGIYRSALASDTQLKLLSGSALAQLKADEACLDAFLKKDKSPIPPISTECRPLNLYVIKL